MSFEIAVIAMGGLAGLAGLAAPLIETYKKTRAVEHSHGIAAFNLPRKDGSVERITVNPHDQDSVIRFLDAIREEEASHIPAH